MNDFKEGLEAFEKAQLTKVLKHTKGSVFEAAAIMGVTPKTVYNKLERYDIDPSVFRPGP